MVDSRTGEVLVTPAWCRCWTCPACCARLARGLADHYCQALVMAGPVIHNSSVSEGEWMKLWKRLQRAGAGWLRLQEGNSGELYSTVVVGPCTTLSAADAAARLHNSLLLLTPRSTPQQGKGVISSCRAWVMPREKPTGLRLMGVVTARCPSPLRAALEKLGARASVYTGGELGWRIQAQAESAQEALRIAQRLTGAADGMMANQKG